MVSECVLLCRIQGAMQVSPQCKCKVVVTVVVMFENVSSGHEHGMICSAERVLRRRNIDIVEKELAQIWQHCSVQSLSS